ncbi:signal transduction histidine kinase [Actinomadura pelletieri DSM 43383]|uniref:histidine kinase n=1 Tax=Actinomadura pelletieri DSM 43383 TaxID=1120940 RepID=A0A495QN62_9ACTN|nr:histidine kinase [Actinomadura pelletieri]RKS74423.1 signal transduction histidine kinase [Actinomadura pelletieri DSM 43383]
MRVRGWWSTAWPSPRSRAFDVLIALALAVGDGTFLWFAKQEFWLPPPVTAASSVLIGLSLVVRRVYPVHLTVFVLVVGTITGGGAFAPLVVLYSLAAYTSSRRTVLVLAVACYVVLLAFPAPTAGTEPFAVQAISGIALIAVPVLLGLYMGARKQLLASLQERAARLEREQHLLAERARGEERTRIAREMHDVVANRISVMVVHAGALKAIAVRDPSRAAETASVIGDMGRQALEELRHVIGVLRQGEEALPQEAVTLAHVRELVGQSGAAGLRVDLSIRGDERPMPIAVGRTVYRLVQEALTNVHKHAGSADTRVGLDLLPEAIEVEIANDRPVAGPDHRLPSGGNGLVGLRERVTALGGSFEAGPDGGGYAVRARIPLPAS